MMERKQNNTFTFPIRVYWEDTDGGGVVYHSNYLNFGERSRTEWLRAKDIHQTVLREKEGIVFVVRSCNVKYKISARLDDLLDVTVAVQNISSHKLQITQRVMRGTQCCAELVVELVAIGAQTGRLVAIPPTVAAALT